ncbi:MAG: APC family permease [Sphingomonadaceae bacterium]
MNNPLPRVLGPVGATLFVITYTIGTAIFLVPGVVAAHSGSIPMSLVLWIAGGLLTLCGALCYAELAVRLPQSGGEYRYMFSAFGPRLAFVFAWTTLLTAPVGISAVARGFADYLAAIWPMDETMRRTAGAVAIAAFAFVSIVSTRAATRVASIAAIGKLLALLTIAVIGILVTSNTAPDAVAPPSGWGLAQLATAMVAIIWAFDGNIAIVYVAGEVREPGRTLPISLLAGLGIITLAYLLMNLVYFHVLGFDGVAASDAVAAATLHAVIGPAGAVVVAVMVMASALGTVGAQLVGNPRYFLGPAQDGLFPAKLAAISPRTLTPINAILLTAAIAIGLVTIGGYEFLLRLYVLSFYPLVVVALFGAVRLRRRDGKPRDFSMPLYPLPLLVYGASIVGICVASAFDDPASAALGLLVPLAGAVVYSLKFR